MEFTTIYKNGKPKDTPQRYKVVKDLQGGEFAMDLNFTVEQWQKQALVWCWYDDNDELADYICHLPKDDILPLIAEIWQIEFAPIDGNEQLTEYDVTVYTNETLEQFYKTMKDKNSK